MTTVFPPALFLLLVFALLSPSSLPWRTDAFVLVPLTKHHLPNSPLVSSSSFFLDPDRQDATFSRAGLLFGGITRTTTCHHGRWATTPLSMTSDDKQQQPQQDVVVTTMEQYIDDEDWDGLETYWQSLGIENTAQEQDNPPVVSWTTAILQQRLRALRKQHKAVQAEALLRTHLNSNDKNTIVNDICWLHVLRAHASLMGHAKKRRGQKGENDNNDDDNDADDDVYDDDTRLQHVQALLKEMARGSRTHATWTLSIHAYNAVLQAMARHPNHHNKAILGQAENILFGLLDKYNNNNNNKQQPSTSDHQDMVIPNAGSFFYVYQASQRAPFPKVETLWHLQVSLWRQLHANGDTAAAMAVVPSVRNLNAALAALARSHIPNKAHKAQTLVQQLHDIRQEAQQQQSDQDTSSSSSSGVVLPSMQPNVGTYKNLMYAAAFTSHAHASPRERKLALEMAMDIHRRMIMGSASSSSSSSMSLLKDDNDDDATLPPSRLPVRDQTLFYRLALQAVGHLVDNRTQRDERAVRLFQAACKAGVVDATVVTAFERAASETTVLRILGGFAEDLIQLPPSWTAQIRAAVEA